MPESVNIKLPIHITLENTQRTWLEWALITMGRMKKTDGKVMLQKGRKKIKITKGLMEGKKGFPPSSLKGPANV